MISIDHHSFRCSKSLVYEHFRLEQLTFYDYVQTGYNAFTHANRSLCGPFKANCTPSIFLPPLVNAPCGLYSDLDDAERRDVGLDRVESRDPGLDCADSRDVDLDLLLCSLGLGTGFAVSSERKFGMLLLLGKSCFLLTLVFFF